MEAGGGRGVSTPAGTLSLLLADAPDPQAPTLPVIGHSQRAFLGTPAAAAANRGKVRSETGWRKVSLWMRSTLCFRRNEDGWRIAHAHTSVPFHMDGSFRAAVDLQPEAT
jgi:hypothetical protein